MLRAGKFRIVLSVVLAALLVAIQQFGFAHALTHLATPASNAPQKAPRGDLPHPAEKVCIECVAFAQLGASLTGSAVPLTTVASPIPFAAVPLASYAAVFSPHFHSRAPPHSA